MGNVRKNPGRGPKCSPDYNIADMQNIPRAII